MIHSVISLLGRILTKGKLSTLIYHQVFKENDPMRASEPDAETFRWQMTLVKRHFTPLSISSALEQIQSGTLPANAICITFDDGYINNLTVAAPILHELGIPATVFVATGFSSGENMWNDRLIDLISLVDAEIDLSAVELASVILSDINQRVSLAHKLIGKIKYLPFNERKVLIDKLYQDNDIAEKASKMMTPAQLIELEQLGIEIGAHTIDHPILKVLEKEQQRKQIQQSKLALEQWLGHEVKGFAYPNGKIETDYDIATRNIVEECGFAYAVSTNWGFSDIKTDFFQILRFTPWDQSPIKFHFRLLMNLLKS
jgi:peptidoglycan/xylan/chitin deacetylase (PgdA/CDA1 family)